MTYKTYEEAMADGAGELLEAIGYAREVRKNNFEEYDGEIGFSAKRTISGGGRAYHVTWEVTFCSDMDYTIIADDEDYTSKTDEEIAEIVLSCWDADWDESDE